MTDAQPTSRSKVAWATEALPVRAIRYTTMYGEYRLTIDVVVTLLGDQGDQEEGYIFAWADRGPVTMTIRLPDTQVRNNRWSKLSGVKDRLMRQCRKDARARSEQEAR